MSIKINTLELPKTYKRNGSDCYLDPIRKRLTYVTPEEKVRQQVITYLLRKLVVPEEMILVEEHLSHYGISSKLRADIIIHKYDNLAGLKRPLAVIECKAPGILLGEVAKEQVLRYTDDLGADYAMLTDGESTYCFKYDYVSEKYVNIEMLPEYEKMVDGEYLPLITEGIPSRLKFDRLEDGLESYVGLDIGNLTDRSLAIPLVNLWECFLDVSRKMPCKKYRMFELVEDYGIRLLSYGNASGGRFSGPYRSLIVNTEGNIMFISMNVSSYYISGNPDKTKTCINVAIDTDDSAHHSLQLVADDNIKRFGNTLTVGHSGRIAIGNIGSGKVNELKTMIRSRDSLILNGDDIYLGSLNHNRLWYMDDSEIVPFIENLVSYAIVRDQYRNEVKHRRRVTL